MATSYFRERARNPYLKPAIGLEDEQGVTSPTFGQPMSPAIAAPPPLEVIGAPRAIAPPVRPPATSPYETIEREREIYAAGAPTTTKGRILQALANAGLGFLQGAASDRDDPIAAGLGGAATGGAIGAISPRTGRAVQFEQVERPRIEERIRAEEERRKRAIAGEDRARAIRMDEARIANIQGETTARMQPKAVSPLRGRPGDVFLDPVTRQPVAQIPQQEKPPAPPTAAELTIEPSSGKSFEQIARDSYEARGGDAYVLSRLPAWMQQAIKKGTMMAEDVDDEGSPTGKLVEAPADAESIQRAQNALDEAIKRQWEADLQYTRGDVRSRAMRAKKGGQQPAPQAQGSQSGISRSRSQFNSSKFPGLKFE